MLRSSVVNEKKRWNIRYFSERATPVELRSSRRKWKSDPAIRNVLSCSKEEDECTPFSCF